MVGAGAGVAAWVSVPPDGLGYDPKVIDRIVEERKTAQARAAEPKHLHDPGEKGNGRIRNYNVIPTQQGNSADYLTARIARDPGEIGRGRSRYSQRISTQQGSLRTLRPLGKVGNTNLAPKNDAGYAVARLHRQRPDLHAKVLSREISPHAAMVEAGFRRKTITVPLNPQRAAVTLVRHFSPDELHALIEALGEVVA